MPQQIGSAAYLVCPAAALKNMPNRRLAALLNERFDEEMRRNGSLFHAIHGAFRHRGLHLFRAVDERGPEFVMAAKPVPMETTHVVSRLRQILTFVGDHPSALQQALIEALEPSGEAAACAELATQVQWLVEKGHLVAYFNGMLALPAEHPAFRPHAPSARPKAAARKGNADGGKTAGEPDQTPPPAAAADGSDTPDAAVQATAAVSAEAEASGDAGATPTADAGTAATAKDSLEAAEAAAATPQETP